MERSPPCAASLESIKVLQRILYFKVTDHDMKRVFVKQKKIFSEINCQILYFNRSRKHSLIVSKSEAELRNSNNLLIVSNVDISKTIYFFHLLVKLMVNYQVAVHI